MMRFARLFEFEAGQLLLCITTDSDVEGYVLSLETYHQGAFIRTGLPFTNFGDASESMDELTQHKAEMLHQTLIQLSVDPNKKVRSKSGKDTIEAFEKWLRDEPKQPGKQQD